jgi:hypothetical protein
MLTKGSKKCKNATRTHQEQGDDGNPSLATTTHSVVLHVLDHACSGLFSVSGTTAAAAQQASVGKEQQQAAVNSGGCCSSLIIIIDCDCIIQNSDQATRYHEKGPNKNRSQQ